VIFFVLAGTALLGLLFGFIIYFLMSLRHKQKDYALLAQQKAETEKQREIAEQALQDLKTTQAQLIEREKMASLGELTAGIAHEIQNPLNFINNFSEVNAELAEEIEENFSHGNVETVRMLIGALKENSLKIAQHGKRAEMIVKSMLEHSRNTKEDKQATDINALVDEYLHLTYLGMRAREKSFHATLQTHYEPSTGMVKVLPQDLGRVLINLFNNAFYAVSEKKKQTGSAFEPVVTVTTKRTGNRVEILIGDNGTGIPEKVAAKIFQPFFTTKPAGQGTGLGLSLSYDIITKGHGGDIKMQTKAGEFTSFVISLPV
jgi:signal transduction histidine kinase